MFLLPTRGRIKHLRRFLAAAREMGSSLPGLVIVNRDDYDANSAAYNQAITLAPMGWTIRQVDADCYGQAIRAVWDDVKDRDWIGLVSDDLVPCSGNWDSELLKRINGWNVVSSNDGWQATTGNITVDRLHGAIMWSGKLARAVGWIFPGGLRHIFHDSVWEQLGRETGCWQVHTTIMCKHLHESLQGVTGPTIDPQSALWKHDQAWFENWMKTDKDACVARVKALMESCGVRQVAVNFSGVKLMIGTPCASGRYETGYMQSLWATMQMLSANGVECHMAEEKFTADIALARAKIFGAFVRSPCTHLLTIDDDMSWSGDAIVRLFNAHKDFVSIAGPKKRYPLQFAASFTDDRGNPVPLQFDTTSGTMEVGEIGAAFCLITRRCAEKMASSYQELSFIGVTGEREYAVYNPMVMNGRYWSEDFAFCKRWRTLGERVYMIPDVSLGHTGSHTFTGAFLQAMEEQAARMQRTGNLLQAAE